MKTTALCILLSSTFVSGAMAANLAINPGFESEITFDGPPFVGSWEGFNGGGATAATTMMMPRSGAQALTLTISGTPNTFAGAFQDVGVIAGVEYTFSGWHATPSAPLQLGPEIRIEWRDAASEIGRTPNITPAPGASVYTPFSMNATAPAGASVARIVYAVQSFSTAPNGNGIVHVDDISFAAVPEPSSCGLVALSALVLTRRRRQA